MKKYKDEKLNALFSAYAAEGKMPDRSVTEKAKQELEGASQTVPVYATEAVAAGAGGGTSFTVRRKVLVGAIAAILACAMILLVYFLLSEYVFSPSDISLSWSQLNKVTDSEDYPQQEVAPFVQENTVNRYDAFSLDEESPYYEDYEGDVILYYLQYESFGVTVDMFIEIDGFLLDSLEGYREIENDYEAQELLLYIETDDVAERTYVYFTYDVYQYYLEIHTVQEDMIYSVLEEIVYSF